MYPYLMCASPGGDLNNNSPTGGITALPLEYSIKARSMSGIKSMDGSSVLIWSLEMIKGLLMRTKYAIGQIFNSLCYAL